MVQLLTLEDGTDRLSRNVGNINYHNSLPNHREERSYHNTLILILGPGVDTVQFSKWIGVKGGISDWDMHVRNVGTCVTNRLIY